MNLYKIIHVEDLNRLLGTSVSSEAPDLENIQLLEELRSFREKARPIKSSEPVVKLDPVITTIPKEQVLVTENAEGDDKNVAPIQTSVQDVPKKALKLPKGDKKKQDILRFIIEHGGVITTPTVELGEVEMRKKQFEADLSNIAGNKLRKMKSPLLNFLIDNGYSKSKLPKPINTAWSRY